jgi:CRISPR/Cas system-associated protein endoribonuclease Cas2
LLDKGGEKVKGLIFHSSIRFWRFMPKGEKVLAQSKRTAHHQFSKLKLRKGFKMMNFSIDILMYSKGGESSIFKIGILKPS